MWDERYSNPEFAYGKKPNEFLASLKLQPDGRQKILCLAEGEGRNAVYLASLGYEVLAVDQSAKGLEKAEILAKESGVTIGTQQADLSSYEIPPGTYDGVVSIFGHLSSSVRRQVHRRAIAGLKPSGFLIIEAYSKEQLNFKTGGPKDLDMLYDLADLESDFDDQLEFVVKRKLERDIFEGKFHTGRGSVIQIFGFKK